MTSSKSSGSAKTVSSEEDQRFNETLKRMLKTPPKPLDKAAKGKPEAKPKRRSPPKQDR